MGGDVVGAGDFWRGGRSGIYWKDRGKGDRRRRGRVGEEVGLLVFRFFGEWSIRSIGGYGGRVGEAVVE